MDEKNNEEFKDDFVPEEDKIIENSKEGDISRLVNEYAGKCDKLRKEYERDFVSDIIKTYKKRADEEIKRLDDSPWYKRWGMRVKAVFTGKSYADVVKESLVKRIDDYLARKEGEWKRLMRENKTEKREMQKLNETANRLDNEYNRLLKSDEVDKNVALMETNRELDLARNKIEVYNRKIDSYEKTFEVLNDAISVLKTKRLELEPREDILFSYIKGCI
ncbi:hypothetical protein KY342_06480 [Candidatus Woesearchaeota archaeon]|nr:hypothetical protein [Candidatus Woesearchaeota archaeon]